MMNLERTIYLIWTAYNEEKTLPQSFASVEKSVKYAEQFYPLRFKSIICHNGCTDKTPQVALKLAEKASFQTNVIKSDKGMVIAQNACIEKVLNEDPKATVVFTDADCVMNRDVISLFLEQFDKHPELMAVGAHPIPCGNRKMNPIRKFKHKMLNFRAYHPEMQIAKVFAPEYHPLADMDPQPIGSEFEKKSKTYFHGRCFALRFADVWDVPHDAIGEDTYLDCSIHTRFGSGSIRMLYHANVFFEPIDNIRNYLKTYARIYKDKENLRKNPSFEENLRYSETKLDFKEAKKLPFDEKLAFGTYYLISSMSNFLFGRGFMIKKNVNKLWSYETKGIKDENSHTPTES